MRRQGNQPVHKARLSAGVLVATAMLFGGIAVAMALSPAQGAPPAAPAQVADLLECDERSLDEDGETRYVITGPPDFVRGYESGLSPEAVAAEFAGQQPVAVRPAPRLAMNRSPERVDFPLAAPDGRIVGVATAVNPGGAGQGGWQQGGGIVCAGG
jgi:hypothetical protein